MVSEATCTWWRMDKSASFASSANPSLDHSWIGRPGRKNDMASIMAWSYLKIYWTIDISSWRLIIRISHILMWHSLVRYWYLQDKDFALYHVSGTEEHQFVPDALSRLCVNNVPPPPTLADKSIVALRPVMNLPQDVYDRIAAIHTSIRGHVGLKLCKRRFRMINKQRFKNNLEPMS